MNNYCIKKIPNKVIYGINNMPDDIKINIYEYCIDYTSVLEKQKEKKQEIISNISSMVVILLCIIIGTLITGKISIVMLFINLLIGYLVLLAIILTLMCIIGLPLKIYTILQ